MVYFCHTNVAIQNHTRSKQPQSSGYSSQTKCLTCGKGPRERADLAAADEALFGGKH
jgi:hypothetical protein